MFLPHIARDPALPSLLSQLSVSLSLFWHVLIVPNGTVDEALQVSLQRTFTLQKVRVQSSDTSKT